MAIPIGTLAADVNLLNGLVQFANQVLLGGPKEDAVYNGESYPTRAKLAASFLLGLNTYPDIETGLANTGENGFFQIVSDIDSEYVVLYQVVNGQAEEKKRYPSSAVVDIIISAKDAATAAERAAAQSAANAATAEVNAAKAEQNALTASEASGNILFYDTYADASTATLEEGEIVEILSDETRQHRQARYRYESGSLIFKNYPRQFGSFGLPYFGHSKYITENPLFEPDSNYATIGPHIYISDGVTVTIPKNTDWTILSGKEFN